MYLDSFDNKNTDDGFGWYGVVLFGEITSKAVSETHFENEQKQEVLSPLLLLSEL